MLLNRCKPFANRILSGERRGRPFTVANLVERRRNSSSATSITNNAHQPSPLHVLGSGSIGLFLAATIRRHHPQYRLKILLRKHHAEYLQSKKEDAFIQVSIQQPSTGPHIQNVEVPARLISNLKEEEPLIDTLVLTTKAFQAVEALQSIHESLADNARIVVLCNGGLAVREALERNFPHDRWRIELASITHGVYRSSPYCLTHAGMGKLFLVRQEPQQGGCLLDALAPSLLDEANLNCRVVSPTEMEDILWYKLAANCVCNPITALHQCTNGEMYQHVQDLDDVIEQVVQEVCTVQRIIGRDDCLNPDKVTEFVHQVIEDNWNNRTSMQQDVLHQRPTEIDFLNGYIAKAGAVHGMNCPTNRRLQQQVRELEAQYCTKDG
jgi:2-dehydropantoate 2-reductase